jgi:CRP/FNR family transcriptional regulator, anaerobic regulatory protein
VSASDSRLRRKPFLRELSDDDFGKLTRLRIGAVSLPANRDIVQSGEVGGNLHILTDGWAFRYKTWPDKKRQILDFLLPGDLIGIQSGLLGMIDHSVRTLTAVSVSLLDGRGLDEVIRSSGDVALALAKAHAFEERRMDNRFAVIGRRSAAERLAFLLLDLFERQRRDGVGTPRTCPFPLRRQHIADAIGLTGAHINRTLNRFRREGLASIEDDTLSIHDPTAFSALCGYDKIIAGGLLGAE